MAKRTITQHTCDRCKRTYDESDPAKESQASPPAIVIEFEEPATEAASSFRNTVKFDDLCPRCKSRCSDLVKAIRLESDDKKADAGDKQGSAEEKSKGLDPNDKKPENKTLPETKASDAKVKP